MPQLSITIYYHYIHRYFNLVTFVLYLHATILGEVHLPLLFASVRLQGDGDSQLAGSPSGNGHFASWHSRHVEVHFFVELHVVNNGSLFTPPFVSHPIVSSPHPPELVMLLPDLNHAINT